MNNYSHPFISDEIVHSFCNGYQVTCNSYKVLQDYEDITLKIDTADDGTFALKVFHVGEDINEERLADRCSWLRSSIARKSLI